MDASPVSGIPGLQYLLGLGKTFLINVLRAGPVPQHIAIVMDGNRRYARRVKREVQEGHSAGFETLAATLELCYRVGVKAVTVFAFSIENFNRTPYEVDALMEIAKARLSQIIDNGDLAEQYGIKIRIIGDRSKVPKDVMEVVNKAEQITEKNDKVILNVCFPYTSRDEITSSIRSIVGKAVKGQVDPIDIDEGMIEENMYTGDCPPLDILIRSSGVERLSDFMLWQCHQGARIEFVKTLWPDFGFWNMYGILLRWSSSQNVSSWETEEEDLEAGYHDNDDEDDSEPKKTR